MQAHTLPLARAERSALVPDRVRDPEPPKVVHEPGATQRPRLRFGEAKPGPGLGGEIGHRARVAQAIGRLEIDEVRDREQRGVEPIPRKHDRKLRLGANHRLPRVDVVEAVENRLPVRADQLRELGVELLAGALTGDALNRLDAAGAIGDLDELGELRDSRSERYV